MAAFRFLQYMEEETCWNNHPSHILSQSNTSGNVVVKIEASTSPPGIPRAFDAFSCPGGREFDHLSLPGGGAFDQLS